MTSGPKHSSDRSHRLLFSHPEMVEALLRGFVHEPWVEAVDFSSLERLPDTWIHDRRGERRSDVVWRLELEGRSIYVCLLIEFQSTPDRWMAVRLIAYMALVWQQLIKERRLLPDGSLPPVIPILLYNGRRPWRSATELSSLFPAELPTSLRAWVPRFRYLAIDERRLPRAKLEELHNLVAAVILLERNRGPEDLRRILDRLLTWLEGSGSEGLQRSLTTWLTRILREGNLPEEGIPEVDSLEEFKTMLEDSVQRWFARWERQGFQRGRREGVKKGEAALLLRQMKQKFGPLDAELRRRIEAADADLLLAWGERLLTAESPAEVFAPAER